MYGRVLLATVLAGVLLQGFTLASLGVLASTLAGLCAVGLAGRHRSGAPLQVDAVQALLLGGGAWLAIAALLSPLPAQAGTGVYQQGVGLLACWAAQLDPRRERTWRSLCLLAAALSFLFVLGFVAEALLFAQPRYTSFFVQRNSLCGYALLLVFMLVPRLDGGVRRWPWALAIFCAMFVICFSTSRAAFGALLVGCLALAGIGGAGFRAGSGKLLSALGLWAFLCANLLNQGALVQSMHSVGVVSQQLLADSPFARLGRGRGQDLLDLSPIAASKVASAHERWLIWRGTADLLRAAPWHGYGPGTFHLPYATFSPPGDGSARVYAHNDVLQIAAELGLPGIALMLLVPLALLHRWRRARAGQASPAQARERDSLAAGMVALAAHSVFDYNFYVPATLILCGCVLARLLELTAGATATRPLWPARHFGRVSFAALVSVLAAVPALTLGTATLMSRSHDRAVEALASGRLEEAARLLDRAAALYPHERIEVARAQLFLAAFDASRVRAQRAEFIDLAQEHLARAERMNAYLPEVPFTRLLLAERAPAMSDTARAAALAAAYADTLRRDRRYFQVRLELARHLRARGDAAQARGLLEAGLREPFPAHPQVIDYLRLLAELRQADGDVAGAERATRERDRLRPVLARGA